MLKLKHVIIHDTAQHQLVKKYSLLSNLTLQLNEKMV